MSARAARFEVVRSDAGWHARFRAANGRIVWVTEVYTRRENATTPIRAFARAMTPTARIWFSNGTGGSELRFGHPEDTYRTAHAIEVRDVDEREVTR